MALFPSRFLHQLGWLSMFSFLGVMLVGSLRFMFPRVLFEPSPMFRAGFAEGVSAGHSLYEVDERLPRVGDP